MENRRDLPLWVTLRSLVVFAFIYVVTIFCAGSFVLLSPFERKGEFMNMLSTAWARWTIWASGVRVEISGLGNVRPGRSYILVVNHQGFFDIWSILSRFPGPVRFVFKKELLLIPIFGTALKRGGHICIDRSDRAKSVEAINEGREKVIGMGASLLFFAEGTRSADGRIGPFKKGGFITAMEMRLPILPMAIRGSLEILQKKSFLIRPGTVRLRILEEVPIEGYTLEMKDQLTESVRERIVSAYNQL